MPRLLSVNVGLPREIAWRKETVSTAIWKTPVDGARMVRRLNIDGDRQGDLTGHGGVHRAVLVYQIEAYRFWQAELGRTDFSCGQFGENFTVEGMADGDVCIGDRYRIGTALLEVSQPRVTCYRLGIRMNQPDMAALLVKHDRPGFYLRVLEEGMVTAGDVIEQVAMGPERVSVAELNALLYKPVHPRDGLERALRIPSLPPGWRHSLEALLDQERSDSTAKGNTGLSDIPAAHPSWPGFRPLRVSHKAHETADVISLELEAFDSAALSDALPGQYVVVRLGPAPGFTRSYSLAGEPQRATYRLGIKREAHGAAGSYVSDVLNVGDLVPTSAPRGQFTLHAGDGAVVLASAGIGVTPVLAMLHALVAERSRREIWWLHGARSGREHPFADEAKMLLAKLPNARSHICYSAPDPSDRLDADFDTYGRLSLAVLQSLDVSSGADFYICGPAAFMGELTEGLLAAGTSSDHLHTEAFGAVPTTNPGVIAAPARRPHAPEGLPGSAGMVSFARSGLNVRWSTAYSSLLELAEACDVPVRWSCRSGVCHTCESALIAGAVNYQPDPIDAPPDGTVLICCSRPEADIVLDL